METVRIDSGDVTAIAFTGRLDAGTAAQAEEAVRAFLRQSDRGKLIIDLSGLDYISSAGLRVLIVAGKGVLQRGGRLALCGVRGNVREVLTVTGLGMLFDIAENRDQALGRLGPRASGAPGNPCGR